MPKTKNRLLQKKRQGLHRKQSKQYKHVYWPYLPAVLLIFASMLISGLRLPGTHGGVLAYATEMSTGGLLASTNQQRGANGKAALTLNSRLNSAAQAKANDMVARNYWSHNTPDGQEPWVFVDQAGYKYTKAGENLAYGFTTSPATVDGWMNSPAHKANMLDAAFSEVGFGYANSNNYNQDGPETVVVAMYGQPQTLAAETPAPTTPAPVQKAPAAKPAAPVPAAPAPAPEPAPAPAETKPVPATQTPPVTTEQKVPDKIPEKHISRIQAITGGKAPWAVFGVGLMGGSAVSVMFISHGLRLHKWLKKGGKLLRTGERFVLHHAVLDVTMISVLIFALTLNQVIGTTL